MAFDVKPKFVTFDMNGTLIHFRIGDAIRRVLGDRLPPELADDFTRAGNQYRIDECMGEYKPFHRTSRTRWCGPAHGSAWSTERATARRCTSRSPLGRRTQE